MNKITLATLVASVVAGHPTHAQNLILNGSFELPAIGANSTLQATPVSWLGGNQPVIVNGDYSAGYPLPQEGQQYVGLVHAPGLSQAAFLSQTFTISSGGNYLLNWYDSTEFNFPNFSPYSVTVTDSLANTVASENFDADAHSLRVWTKRSIAMTLAPDSYTLRFQGNVAPSGEGSLIDNVSLVVPEPAGGVLLLCGMAILVSVRRHRKSSAPARAKSVNCGSLH